MVWRWWQRQSPLSWLNWICWKKHECFYHELHYEPFLWMLLFSNLIHHMTLVSTLHATKKWSSQQADREKKQAGQIFRVFVKNSFSIGKGWGDSVQLHRLWPFVSHKNKHTWLSVFCWKFKNKPLFKIKIWRELTSHTQCRATKHKEWNRTRKDAVS